MNVIMFTVYRGQRQEIYDYLRQFGCLGYLISLLSPWEFLDCLCVNHLSFVSWLALHLWLTGSRLLHQWGLPIWCGWSAGDGWSWRISHPDSQLNTSPDERDTAQGLWQHEGCLLVQGIKSWNCLFFDSCTDLLALCYSVVNFVQLISVQFPTEFGIYGKQCRDQRSTMLSLEYQSMVC